VALLFVLGSACFILGSLPPYFQNLDNAVVGGTFFVGSVLFTSAATMQLRRSPTTAPLWSRAPDRLAWWSSAVQWVGTLCFNISTFAALISGLSAEQAKRLVWAPDFYGSVAFLVSGVLALMAVARTTSTRRDRDVARINMAGSVAFGIAAMAAFVLPTTGNPANVRWVNLGTAAGGVCFLLASAWSGLASGRHDPSRSYPANPAG
jgi:hypothetical protein